MSSPCSFPWYIPSLFGDIELTPDPDGSADDPRTVLRYEKVSDAERTALDALVPDWGGLGASKLAKSGRGAWHLALALDEVRTGVIARLKVGATLSAVRFTNGEIIETTATEAMEIAEKKKTKATAGASVDKPTLGCPDPEFDQADVRATRVLKAFLSDKQRADWDRYNRFVCVGADTGTRYMVISRLATRGVASTLGFNMDTHRSVLDLDRKEPICVHDWSVPAAEEALELFLHLVTPRNERYVTGLAA